jgi:hypothetical protein
MARRQTVTVRGQGGVDTSDFRATAKVLRTAAPDVNKKLRKGLREAGLVVAEEAKKIASEHSKTIAGTVKVRVASTTVAVVAGGKTPLAALYELGNTGNHARSATAGGGGTFRHPVFGNMDNWVSQKSYPFLAPAAVKSGPVVERLVLRELDEVIRHITFE